MKNKILEKNGLKWSNKYYECDDYITLNISKEETGESYDVLINKEDFNLVSKGQWFVNIGRKNTDLKDIIHILWTKKINGKRHNYNIYQWILDTKDKNIIIDHKNMNRLDNRRQNLRISNGSENATNQDHKGYNYDEPTGKYLVRITVNKKGINIGRYDTERQAEDIYLKACLLLHKEDICYNVKERINKLNIALTIEDYNNKYLKKVTNAMNGIENTKEINGKFNLGYLDNMDAISNLVSEGKSWNYISKYLTNNKLMDKAKGSTVKKYYEEYIRNKQNILNQAI